MEYYVLDCCEVDVVGVVVIVNGDVFYFWSYEWFLVCGFVMVNVEGNMLLNLFKLVGGINVIWFGEMESGLIIVCVEYLYCGDYSVCIFGIDVDQVNSYGLLNMFV